MSPMKNTGSDCSLLHPSIRSSTPPGVSAPYNCFRGTAGYTLSHGSPDDDYPALDTCSYNRREVLKTALASRLIQWRSQ